MDERLKTLKLQSLKKEAKKWFGPDPQDTIQTTTPEINATFQIPQKARTNKRSQYHLAIYSSTGLPEH